MNEHDNDNNTGDHTSEQAGCESNVKQFPGTVAHETQPDNVLENAYGVLQECVVIGFQHDGSFYFDSSNGEVGAILTMLELAKKKLLEGF